MPHAAHVDHIVLLKIKPGTSSGRLKAIEKQVRGLKHAIPGIISVTAGKNVSAEERSRGFSFGYVIRFISAAARDAYLVHPKHQEVAERILPLAEDVLVFDYVLNAT